MSSLIPRGFAELFYGNPTLSAYERQLPLNGRLAVIPVNLESSDEMLARLAADRAN